MRKIILATIVAGIAFAAQPLLATDYYFKQNTASVGSNAFWANWDTTTTNWDTTSTTTPTKLWPNVLTDSAIFDYYNETTTFSMPHIIIQENIVLNSLISLTSGTVGWNAAGARILLYGSAAGKTLTVSTFDLRAPTSGSGVNLEVTLNANLKLIGGNNGAFTKKGAQTLTLTGTAGYAYEGTIIIEVGNVNLTTDACNSNTNIVFAGFYPLFYNNQPQATINIGNISTDRSTNPTAGGAIQWAKTYSAGTTYNGKLVINQTQDAVFWGSISGSGTGDYSFAVEKLGAGKLTLSGQSINGNFIEKFSIYAGSIIINTTYMSNSGVSITTDCAVPIGDNGTLASAANGQGLLDSTNQWNATTGQFNTVHGSFKAKGYTVQPASSADTGNISPTGLFGITHLDTTIDGKLKINIDDASDKISVLTLKNDNGKIVFDLTSFLAIAEAIPYTFLMWSDYTGTGGSSSVNLANFEVALPAGWGLDTSYGTGGFQIDTIASYGKSLSFQLIAIPEPATWLLLGASLLVVTLFRRKKIS